MVSLLHSTEDSSTVSFPFNFQAGSHSSEDLLSKLKSLFDSEFDSRRQSYEGLTQIQIGEKKLRKQMQELVDKEKKLCSIALAMEKKGAQCEQLLSQHKVALKDLEIKLASEVLQREADKAKFAKREAELMIEVERLKLVNENKIDTQRQNTEAQIRDLSHVRDQEKLQITSKLEMLLQKLTLIEN